MPEASGNGAVAVLTTIQRPTRSVRRLVARLRGERIPLVVVGDLEGPDAFDLEGVRFLSLDAQRDLPFSLARSLPTGHYTRKNVGYLAAIRSGAGCIYETDDDNSPGRGWTTRAERCAAAEVRDDGWVNAYRLFTTERIWPRGFPLDAVVRSHERAPAVEDGASPVRAPIQQGLADGSPDVDAIWRLVLDRPFHFDGGPSVRLPPGAWCPFNSQSTWWWPAAYPLLYLPSHCSFRMTDIWRSFVAQRCLWTMGHGVVFHAPEVEQERNPHDLMRDFRDELPGYARNRELCELLAGLDLRSGEDTVADNLRACYEALVRAELFPREELALVDDWLGDLEVIR